MKTVDTIVGLLTDLLYVTSERLDVERERIELEREMNEHLANLDMLDAKRKRDADRIKAWRHKKADVTLHKGNVTLQKGDVTLQAEERTEREASPQTPYKREGKREDSQGGSTSSTSVTDATSASSEQEKEKKTKFKVPTIDEVGDYCQKMGYTNIDPKQFHAYYESNGWFVGHRKMKSWQSAVTYWHTKRKNDVTRRGREMPAGYQIMNQSKNPADYECHL